MKVFDAHFHVIDFRFPVVENHGYLPPEFKTADYRAATNAMGITGGAIVSGSFQQFDTDYLKASLSELGDSYFGIANLRWDITDAEVRDLKKSRIHGVRFNLKRGGSEEVSKLDYLSNRLHQEFGMRTELYVDSSDLKDLKPLLQKLPTFSIDHLGLSKEGLKELYYWVEQGIKVKATGFGRVDFDPIEAMTQIHRINPASLMFGTDLPSTRAPRPFSSSDLDLITERFEEDDLQRVVYRNAYEWYALP